MSAGALLTPDADPGTLERVVDDSPTIPGAGSRLLAGPRSREGLARVLLAPSSSGAISLDEAEWQSPGRLRLTFRRPKGRLLVVHLKPVAEGGAYVCTRTLGIAVEGDRVGKGLGAWLDRLADRLEGRTLAELVALLEADPDTERDAGRDVETTSDAVQTGEPRREEATATAPPPDEPPAWSRFIDDVLEHETWEPIFPDGSIAMVEHGDRECFFSHPEPHPEKWAFYNDPRLPLPTDNHRPQLHVPTALLSELSEQEVVLGSRDKEGALLEAAAEVDEQCHLLVLNHLCTPVVLGEDLDGLATRLGSASGRPVLQLTRDHKERRDFFSTLLGLVGDEVRSEPTEVRPDAVNLLGFPAQFRETELRQWLAQLDLVPNATVMPEVTAKDLARLGRAGLNLVCADSMTTRKAARWLASLSQPSVVVPSPYGLQGSRACLLAIADAAGRLEAADTCWQTHFEAHRERWEAQRLAAKGLRLGLVVNARTWPLLSEPGRLSVPALPLLAEMGFGLEIFVAETDGFTQAQVAQTAASILAERPPTTCQAVTTVDHLQSALRDRDCRAVYTDYGFDWRLSRAGLGQFSLRHFAPGVQGALQAQQHLLAVARLPFYRRYRQQLTPDPGGQP